MAHHFAKLMMEGKLRAASCLIADNVESFSLALNSKVSIAGTKCTVKDVLLGKHPAGHPLKSSVLVSPSTTLSAPPFHHVLFDHLDGSLICCTILQMDSAAGPSGMDVASWKNCILPFKVLLIPCVMRLLLLQRDWLPLLLIQFVFLPLLHAASLPWINALE